MPYIPSKKTDGHSQDREKIDYYVDILVNNIISNNITFQNSKFSYLYLKIFEIIADCLKNLEEYNCVNTENFYEFADTGLIGDCINLAKTIHKLGLKYDYEGAFLGELNYAITTFIQKMPSALVRNKIQESEFRYYIYAYTVDALIKMVNRLSNEYDSIPGMAGVFEDIKDEYKWRVNRSYEIAQIIKSGDCISAPYTTKPCEVVDENGTFIGYVDICMKNNEHIEVIDELPNQLVLKKRKKENIENNTLPE